MPDYFSLSSTLASFWFQALPGVQQELIKESYHLLMDAKNHQFTLYDYAYVVMPAAKAYEGFVKDLIYKLGLISAKRYQGERFRVGRALNPEYARYNPDGFEALYDDLSKLCQYQIAKDLWETWLRCRNQVFHYFIKGNQSLSLNEAEKRLIMILNTVESASRSCSRKK